VEVQKLLLEIKII